ncbi:MAG: exonuclease domain-containing protein [Candidatus Ornithospirochaeta sp.]
MSYTFIDVEYANNKNRSICQIGLIAFDDNLEEIEEYNSFVNPCDGFDEYCIRVHGITKGIVSCAPSFCEVWNEVSKYFTNSILVGHNVAAADIDAIIKNLRRYGLDIPELYYIDTMDLACYVEPLGYQGGLGLAEICDAIGIELEKHHDALSDASASYEILKKYIERNGTSELQNYVERYVPHETREFNSYISDSDLRHLVYEFYGKLKGFRFDGTIQPEEKEVIQEFYNTVLPFATSKRIEDITGIIEKILEDGIVTIEESQKLEKYVGEYLTNISTSQISASTQILEGIIKGIRTDNVIKKEECDGLREWMESHDYLVGHYPFDRIMKMLDGILDDGIVTEQESERLKAEISSILDPVASSSQIEKPSAEDLTGKIICLSGNFDYGSKSEVEEYLVSKGAIIESSVKKTTNILLVGSKECSAWSNGNYGNKVKKAIEYNEKYTDKGVSIKIVKEKDLIC